MGFYKNSAQLEWQPKGEATFDGSSYYNDHLPVKPSKPVKTLSTDGDPSTLDYINSGTQALGAISTLVNTFKGGSSSPAANYNPQPVIVQQSPPAKGLSTGAIIGIAAGSLVLLTTVILLATSGKK